MFLHLVKPLGVAFTGIGFATHRPYTFFPQKIGSEFQNQVLNVVWGKICKNVVS